MIFRNHVITALRTLRRQGLYSLINVLGLAIGFTFSVLLFLYLQQELAYDRHHPRQGYLFRTACGLKFADRYSTTVQTPRALGPALGAMYGNSIEYSRVQVIDRMVFTTGQHRGYVGKPVYADSNFFGFFNAPLLAGEASTALATPNSVVISKAVALRFFGKGEPMGQVLQFGNTPLKVTGVLAPNNQPTHMAYDLLISMATQAWAREPLDSVLTNADGWRHYGTQTYFYLPQLHEQGASLATTRNFLNDRLEVLETEFINKRLQGIGGQSKLWAQDVRDIHLYSKMAGEYKVNGDVVNLWVFSIIAAIMLLLAAINYTNLSTAHAATRTKEVGIRKSLGSSRWDLIHRFILESLLLAAASLVLGLVVADVLSPLFSQITGVHVSVQQQLNLKQFFRLLLLMLAMGILGGIYPALFLSRFQPTAFFKRFTRQGPGGLWLRRVLVITQFAVFIIMIIATLMVDRQLRFFKEKDLGIVVNGVVVLDMTAANANNQADSLAQVLRGHPAIMGVGRAQTDPGGGNHSVSTFEVETDMGYEQHLLHSIEVDPHFVHTLDIALLSGFNYDSVLAAEEGGLQLMANEALLRQMGWTVDNALGREVGFNFNANMEPASYGHVVGVVEDFHMKSLDETIPPTFLILQASSQRLLVRLDPWKKKEGLAYIEEVWGAMVPAAPFDFWWLESNFEAVLYDQQRILRALTLASLVTIFIACLGLFGLASYTAMIRTKEIGIRKVVGAPVGHIVLLSIRDYLLLLGMAMLIAWPTAYLLVRRWLLLGNLSVGIDWRVFIWASLMAVGLTLFTVSYHTIRAALLNPTRALRAEQ